MHVRGPLYRALNPLWARQPLSGDGARLYGGRFNAKGTAALYTSLSIMTAIRESNQAGTLQPTTLVCYEADLEPVADAADTALLRRYDMTPQALAADDWRLRMIEDGLAPTQRFAGQLAADGFVGLRVRSFARGAAPDDINVVLWQWGEAPPAVLRVIDDEGRLR